MLDQHLVTDIVKRYLQENYPELLAEGYDRPDGSFECELQSPSRHFSLWIATYNNEITLGLQSPDGDSGCHTHFVPYDLESFPEVLEDMTGRIREIMSDKWLFYHSSRRGYSWTDDMEKRLEKKKKDETLLFFSWTGKLD